MEKPPNQTGDDLTKSCTGSSESSEIKSEATKKRNKEEHQFASIHIAEQSHTERNKLCKVLDDVHRKIERPQKRELAERCSKELNDKTRKALDLDAVVEKKKEHAKRDAEGAIQVSRGQRTQVVNTKETCNSREEVDRNKVDAVHHGNPAENRQGKRCNERTIAVNDIFCLIVDHFNKHFHSALYLPRHIGSCLLGTKTQKEENDQQRQDGEKDGVVVHYGKINNHILLERLQMLHVMLNVLSSARGVGCHEYQSLVFFEQHYEITVHYRYQ